MKKVGIIGAGKVGVSLGNALFSAGPLQLGGYYSRSRKSAAYGAKRTNSACFETLEALIEASDVILIATPDDAIEGVWRQLLQLNISGKILGHTAGSLSSSLFFDRTTNDVFAGSLHPLLAIADKETGYGAVRSAFFTLEGDDEAVAVFRECLDHHRIAYKVMTSSDKATYHLATSAISNLAVALAAMSFDLLKDVGFNEEEARAALRPLATENMEKIFDRGPACALTGPVERCDLSTVRRHLEALKKKGDAEEEALYRAGSMILTTIAEKKHEDRPYDDLRGLLKGEEV
ncbi:MAG: Rossmann-like and DUF2520 domain-containing protein [Peptoniphilus sp.]|nr:Rossmann-like and DUF2520 domain-containing protein [Peptoniphilus sp.]MDY3118141.1 Rossmann-like and DUF2520 domain-containing protein [Peptoniphilus sp.]